MKTQAKTKTKTEQVIGQFSEEVTVYGIRFRRGDTMFRDRYIGRARIRRGLHETEVTVVQFEPDSDKWEII